MELIIFDMDGLMVDTEAVTYRAFEEIGKEWGLATSRELYISLIGLDMRATCDAYREIYGPDIEAEKLFKSVGHRMEEIMEREGVPMKKGLLPLVEAIGEKGIKMVVASGSPTERIIKNLKECGIYEKFDGIISSDDVERGKPFPDVFLEICKRQEVEPQNALVLEDSPAGIEAAVAGSIPVIGIPDMKPFSEEVRDKCFAVGESLIDVIPYL